MPKYKVGDIAASLPQPKAPTTESGKKLQDLFNQFYNKDKKKTFQANNISQVKNEDNSLEITSNSVPASVDVVKGKKRKKSQLSNSVSDERNEFAKELKKDVSHEFAVVKGKKRKKSQLSNFVSDEKHEFSKQGKKDVSHEFAKQEEKDVSHPNQQNFPRRKKSERREIPDKATHRYFPKIPDNATHKYYHDDQPSDQKQSPNSFQYDKKAVQAQSKNSIFNESQSKVFGDKTVLNKKRVKPVHKKWEQGFQNTNIFPNYSFKMKHQNQSNDVSTQLEISNKRNKKKFKKTNSDFVSSNNQNSPISKPYQNTIIKSKDSEPKMTLSDKDSIPLLQTKEEKDADKLGRTLYVGNLPKNITSRELKKLFVPFGGVESLRIRGGVPKKQSLTKRVAAIKGEYHQGIHSLKGFVVFKDRTDALKALMLNGTLFKGHHILVDEAKFSSQQKTYDDERTVFIGNLPFDVDDETVWSTFSQFGEIDRVRVVRDRETGVGKGFGYVLFLLAEAKNNALALENVEIGGRSIRIKSVESNQKQKKKPAVPATPFNSFKVAALRMKKKSENTASRKSTKKIMNKQKILHKKKQISQILLQKMA